MPGVMYHIGADNRDLRLSLQQAESMVDAHVRRAQAKLGGLAAGGMLGMGVSRAGMAASQMERTLGITNRLNSSLDRMSGLFTTGLGIGAALGGFALLERAFERSIKKATEFQTAQIAIAATLQSSYKIVNQQGSALSGPQGFQVAQAKAAGFNQQIIERQARNILVYQEQLGAFQSSVAAGARKGLRPEQVLDLSEQAAVVAKTLGLRGEQIANASRLLMGGGVNVARSTIGRALGISNQDISSRQGDEFAAFLQEKMKGFKQAEPSFAKSIEGIMSTLEAKFDVFFAKVGKKFMDKIAPSLEELGKALEGPNAERFAGTLADLFESLFKALKAIIDSGALATVAKFIEFLAAYGDKILIVGALGKLLSIVGSLAGGLSVLSARLKTIAVQAIESAGAVETLAVASNHANAAATGGGGMLPRGVRGVDPLTNALQAKSTLGMTMQAPGTGGVTNFAWYRQRYNAAFMEEQAKQQAVNQSMAGSMLPIGAGTLPTLRQALTGRQAFSRAGLGLTGMTLASRGGSMMMGGMLGYAAGSLIKNQTDNLPGTGWEMGGNFMAGALPVAGALAPLAMGGGPVGAGMVAAAAGVAGTVKMLTASLERADKELQDSTIALDSFYEAHPIVKTLKEADKASRDVDKARKTGKWSEGNANSGLTNFIAGAVHDLTFGLAGDYTGDPEVKNLLTERTLRGAAERAARKKAEAQEMANAEMKTEEMKNLGDEARRKAGLLDYQTSIVDQFEKGKLLAKADVYDQFKAGKLPEEQLDKTLQMAQLKFERDFNMPLKKIQAEIEAINMGEPSEHVIESARLAFDATKNKILRLANEFDNIAGMGAMVDQVIEEARAKMNVTIAMAQDADRQRRILGGSPTERMYTSGGIELFQRDLNRRGSLYGNMGYRSMQGAANLMSDIQGKAAGGAFSNTGEMNQYALSSIRTFQFDTSMAMARQKLEDQRLALQGGRMVDDFGEQKKQLSFESEVSRLNREKAALGLQMWTGNAPQYSDAASAIRYKVDSEMAAEKSWNKEGQFVGFDTEGYEASYKRTKEIELREMEIGSELASIQEERVKTGKSIARLEEDYALALAEYNLTLQERAEKGLKQGDVDDAMKYTEGIKQYIKGGGDLLAPAREAMGLLPRSGGSRGAGQGGQASNNITVQVPVEKIGMTDAEITKVADRVRTQIITDLRRQQART